jgi:tRNA nucleotidyltransferase (CCA-adding enzyme)
VPVRRATYPQVDPRARGLMRPDLVVVPPDVTIGLAARLASHRQARLVAARLGANWTATTPETLGRALALGLHQAPLAAVLWDAPVEPAKASEVAVRRRLDAAHPFLLVGDRRRPEGVVFREPRASAGLPLSVERELDRLPRRVGDILRIAGAQGEALGSPVAAVGGLVRDMLLDRVNVRTDLDLVVEGRAPAVARAVARELGGKTVEHPAFLTATVILPDGRRIDFATARQESYRAAGALPVVERASLAEDLGRRDFSLNSLAIRLDDAERGRLVDTTGGLADLQAKRIRVLHPLSFVEDPTRIFRAARFAARLGCRIDRATRRLAVEAGRLDVYRAVSGDRLRAELELLLAEPRPVAALREAGRLGAWRLLGAPAAPGREASRLLAAALAPRALTGLAPDTPVGLSLLALTEGTAAIETWMDRISLAPARRESIRSARRDAPRLIGRLADVREPSAAYGILSGMPGLTLAWARALAGPSVAGRHLDRHLRTGRRIRLLATGDDVAALGVPPGPEIGAILRKLRAAQAEGHVRSRTGALRWLQGTVARARGRREAALTRPGTRGG